MLASPEPSRLELVYYLSLFWKQPVPVIRIADGVHTCPRPGPNHARPNLRSDSSGSLPGLGPSLAARAATSPHDAQSSGRREREAAQCALPRASERVQQPVRGFCVLRPASNIGVALRPWTP